MIERRLVYKRFIIMKVPHTVESDMDMLWTGITGDHGKQPSEHYLSVIVAALSVIGALTVWYFKTSRYFKSFYNYLITKIILSASSIKALIRDLGVQLHKISRTAMEIERKMFHLAGLI
jgi:hypothetical protein